MNTEGKDLLRNQRDRIKRQEARRSKTQACIDQANEKLAQCLGATITNEFAWRVVKETKMRNKSILAALACYLVAFQEKPTTVRAVTYRLAGVGIFPGTHDKYYNQTQHWILKLRRAGFLPYQWIVDNLRQTRKVSSWAGLTTFLEHYKEAYRHDFWTQQNHYVCVICEANASAATLQPVTMEFDIALHPLGGQTSATFISEIAREWRQIEKPIYVYYFGDLNPRGIHIEEKTRSDLQDMSGREVDWGRLGVNRIQAIDQGLPRMELKLTENKNILNGYRKRYGDWGCELEALPSTQLRQLLQESIESHIDMERWNFLQEVESGERNLLELVEKQAAQLTTEQLHNLKGVTLQHNV